MKKCDYKGVNFIEISCSRNYYGEDPEILKVS